jgi:tellurite resistance protein TehA-like permease
VHSAAYACGGTGHTERTSSRHTQVGQLMQPALLLAAAVGLALVMITLVFADPILTLVATPASIHVAAKTYLCIRILSQPAVRRPPSAPSLARAPAPSPDWISKIQT